MMATKSPERKGRTERQRRVLRILKAIYLRPCFRRPKKVARADVVRTARLADLNLEGDNIAEMENELSTWFDLPNLQDEDPVVRHLVGPQYFGTVGDLIDYLVLKGADPSETDVRKAEQYFGKWNHPIYDD